MESQWKCTSCGGDATVAMSDFKEAGGRVIIRKNERLCLRCAKARGAEVFGTNPQPRGGR